VKNFCQNKDPSENGMNAIPKPETAPQLGKHNTWDRRSCRTEKPPSTGVVPNGKEAIEARIKELQNLLEEAS
jgi:hypothetical protein